MARVEEKSTYHIVKFLISLLLHPPLEWEDEEGHFDEVEGSDEDVLVGSTDELHCLL